MGSTDDTGLTIVFLLILELTSFSVVFQLEQKIAATKIVTEL